ncbi:acyltransferase family protein [Corynebacterium endometrii]|uniref:acyltransferase family protein n=1 Tax=Corynebacterium endometrii TaxID=2488819 RepID=UPI00109C86F4|nr:acyltransferase family protein [Corynebacterium endometrii]
MTVGKTLPSALPARAAAPAGVKRLAWPDVAKGISIVGVVLLHVSLQVPDSDKTWLVSLNSWIDPLRMPLFFLVSGFFSSKVLNFSLWELFSRRLWFFIVPYIIWVCVELTTARELAHQSWGQERLGVGEVAGNLLLGHNMGWFLHALVIFNLILWSCRKLPPWLSMLVSLSPVLFLAFHDVVYFVGKAMMYLPVFMAGVYLRGFIKSFADQFDQALARRRVTPAVCVAVAAASASYLFGYWVRRSWDEFEGNPVYAWPFFGDGLLERPEILLFVRLIEQSTMLPAAILGAVLISRVPVVSHAFQFVGRHTLPIYLGHPIALTLGYGFVVSGRDLTITVDGAWPVENTWFWILACLVSCAVGSLTLWAISRTPVLKWTMTPPAITNVGRKNREPMVNATDAASQEGAR